MTIKVREKGFLAGQLCIVGREVALSKLFKTVIGTVLGADARAILLREMNRGKREINW